MASKAMIWIGRVISALPILAMVAGLAFVKPEEAKKGMNELGFSSDKATTIIVIELSCVVIYLIPQTAVLGAILLTGYLGGATACHVRVGQPWFMPVVFGVLFWLGLFLRDSRLRALIPFRRL